MKCINCGAYIEDDDNFCYKCGSITAKGTNFFKDEENMKLITNGEAMKQSSRVSVLSSLLLFGVFLFVVMMLIRGNNLFAPFAYIEGIFNKYLYGYETSIIKTDNKYYNIDINSYNDAISYIKKDFDDQSYNCNKEDGVSKLEIELQNNHQIPSVLFCDMKYEEAQKVKEVIDSMYNLFPSIKGALTNITITNSTSSNDFIAYFQPMYQFINVDSDINKYNKVNKTQILLNSYYFLNENILSKPIDDIVGENYYVKDANFESAIAHEIGHYITFYIFLKENNLENVTYVTKDNKNIIEDALANFDSGKFSLGIVMDALYNYNTKNNTELNCDDFALLISKYAGAKDDDGNLIANETIAEAIHDFYLHGDDMLDASSEILSIINNKLGAL